MTSNHQEPNDHVFSLLKVNCKKQLELTIELFNIILVQFNGLKDLAFIHVEDLCAEWYSNQQAEPKNEQEKIAKELALVAIETDRLFGLDVPPNLRARMDVLLKRREIIVELDQACRQLLL